MDTHWIGMRAVAESPAEAERRRREILRLAAAAAMETHGDYDVSKAWHLAGEMPESVQVRLKEAGALAISDQARRDVREVVDTYLRGRRRKEPRTYPLFAEVGTDGHAYGSTDLGRNGDVADGDESVDADATRSRVA